jgi:biofilm protein TabA
MINIPISRATKYDYLAGALARVYRFLAQDNLAELPIGKLNIEGDDIYAIVQSYQTLPAEQVKFESHEQYIDVQFVLSGQERMGVIARDNLKVLSPYNPAKDVTLYEDPVEYGSLVMNAGDLVVLTPEEAHKPKCQCGAPQPVIKIVVKVKV